MRAWKIEIGQRSEDEGRRFAIVRAETGAEARAACARWSGDEGPLPWLDPELSSCTPLEGEAS